MRRWIWLTLLVLGTMYTIDVYGETITQSFEGGMDVEITYPKEMISGRDGMISILVKNNGWENKQDITFEFSSVSGLVIDPANITIPQLTQGGSTGQTTKLYTSDKIDPGIYFVNLRYTQVLIANNESPQLPTSFDIAIKIQVIKEPRVIIHTKMPESIFADAEFPIEFEIVSQDIDISDVNLRIIPPNDIGFRGETQHSLSKIQKNTPIEITSRIVTPSEDIDIEYKLPFQIIVEYVNDVGETKTDSQTVSVVLRPRTFMELTPDGGIWIGNFFIAPYVSIGTIVGIPAGTILSLLIRRRQERKRAT